MTSHPIKRFFAILLVIFLLQPQLPALQLWAAEQATLDGIEVQPDQVHVHLSDQVRYNTFVTVDPPRLVIELEGTEFSAAAKKQPGAGKFLEQVRAGQYQRDPSLITRIVLDLKKLAAYRANWTGSRLTVTLQGGDAPAEDDEVAAEQQRKAKAPAAPVTPKMEMAAAPPAPVAAAPVVAKAPKPKMRDAATKAQKAAQKAAAVQSEFGGMNAKTSSELMKIAKSNDVQAAPPEPRKKRRKRVGLVSGKMRRDIIATLPTDPITLDFDNMDIGDILKLLASKAKVNIVYGSDVSGGLTLHLVDVPFNEAFMTILSMQGLVANQVGENILRVMTPDVLTRERATSVNQTRVIRLKYVKADEISDAINQVRKSEKRSGGVVIDENTNSLIITDTLDGIASVERLLSQIDVRPQQVMIEAKLVEVNLSKDLAHGVQWDYFSLNTGRALGSNGLTSVGSPMFPGSSIGKPFDIPNPSFNTMANGLTGSEGRGTGVTLPANKIFGAFTFGRVTNNYFLNATLTAAASEGKVKVLSDPKITTMNGKPAEIAITTSFPYVTSSVTATGVSTEAVEYIKTGITMKVTPTVNADGRITLEVEPVVSQPSASAVTAGSTGAIGTDERRAKTIVMVQDGETIVIGGLISDRVSNQIAKIPLLGDIPILGWLFKKKFVERTRVELLIFVTTKLVDS
jgi:type IV pilus secretin PilQ/predicted competence protein